MVDGDLPFHGRVEVFYHETWGTVCHNGWDLIDANIVCRELGFPGAKKALRSAFFGQGSGSIWIDDLQCTGKENSLTECEHRGFGVLRYCRHSQDAGLMCYPGTCNKKNPK